MQAWQKLLIVAVLATAIVVASTLVYFNYAKRRIFISTTTSLYDTGLFDEIELDYESTHNVDLNIVAVGTGIAIQHAENGDADVVLVHAPSVEKSFLEDGYGLNRKIIAYNFFTIVGPEEDIGIRQPRIGGGEFPVDATRLVEVPERPHQVIEAA